MAPPARSDSATRPIGPMQRTLLLCKPDAVARSLTFEIAERFERRGLVMVACRMLRASADQARQHCARSMNGKPGAVEQAEALLTSGPIVVMAWEGVDAVQVALEVAGDADPMQAGAGTVRGDFALSSESNLIEVSASTAAAAAELGLWFSRAELPAGLPTPQPKKAAGVPANAAIPAAIGTPAPAAAPAAAAAVSATPADETPAEGGGEGVSKSQMRKEAKKADKAAKKAAHKGGSEPPPPAISFEPPSGTRDFFPDEMRTRTWLFNKFKEVARQLAFVEYDAPVLEAEQLYVRKGGEEITGQMYNFIDKDGKRVSLRPEMTPTLARMILSLGGKVR
jgi:histidyl-tRNA synthetase